MYYKGLKLTPVREFSLFFPGYTSGRCTQECMERVDKIGWRKTSVDDHFTPESSTSYWPLNPQRICDFHIRPNQTGRQVESSFLRKALGQSIYPKTEGPKIKGSNSGFHVSFEWYPYTKPSVAFKSPHTIAHTGLIFPSYKRIVVSMPLKLLEISYVGSFGQRAFQKSYTRCKVAKARGFCHPNWFHSEEVVALWDHESPWNIRNSF